MYRHLPEQQFQKASKSSTGGNLCSICHCHCASSTINCSIFCVSVCWGISLLFYFSSLLFFQFQSLFITLSLSLCHSLSRITVSSFFLFYFFFISESLWTTRVCSKFTWISIEYKRFNVFTIQLFANSIPNGTQHTHEIKSAFPCAENRLTTFHIRESFYWWLFSCSFSVRLSFE